MSDGAIQGMNFADLRCGRAGRGRAWPGASGWISDSFAGMEAGGGGWQGWFGQGGRGLTAWSLPVRQGHDSRRGPAQCRAREAGQRCRRGEGAGSHSSGCVCTQRQSICVPTTRASSTLAPSRRDSPLRRAFPETEAEFWKRSQGWRVGDNESLLGAPSRYPGSSSPGRRRGGGRL